jgi:FkbM family methyltransferase
VSSVFDFDRSVIHANAALAGTRPWIVSTPAQAWAYAVTLPADWTGCAGWASQHDGVIRLRLRVLEGAISLLATDAADSVVIDQVLQSPTSEPIEVALVTAPLASCGRVVIRNGAATGTAARVAIDSVECVDLGPREIGPELAPPDSLELRPVERWHRYYGTGALTLAERRRDARYSQLEQVARMRWLEGLRVEIHPNDDLSRALYVSGLYEPATMLALKRLLRPGNVFVDVGANAGLFTLVASCWVGQAGRVFSFEPSEREYRRLLSHLELNRLANVTATANAVGDRRGRVHLRVASFPNAGLNTLGDSYVYPGVATDRIEAVEMITLDEFVAANELTRVDVIKLDIEGSELAALKGAAALLRRFRPAVFVEITGGSKSQERSEIGDWLASAGYRINRIDDAGAWTPLTAIDRPLDENVLALPLEREN